MYDEFEKNSEPDIQSSHRNQELFKDPSRFAAEADVISLQNKIKDYKLYSFFHADIE